MREQRVRSARRTGAGLRGNLAPRARPDPDLLAPPLPRPVPPPSPDAPRSAAGTWLGLTLVVLVWGLNFAVIKVPLEVMPPFAVNLWRFLVSLVVLGALHAADARRRGHGVFDALRAAPGAIVALGLVAHVGYQSGFIVGIDRVTAGLGALIMAMSPLWTALIAHAVGTDRLRGRAWLGVALGVVGAALVVSTPRPDAAPTAGSGVVILVGATVAWALYTALSRPVYARGVSTIGFTFWGVAAAMPFIVGLGLWETPETDWARVGPAVWAALLFSGGLSTGLAYGLWNAAVERVGPARTAAFSNLVPFAGVAAGVLLLGEALVPLQVAGGVVVIAGLAVLRRA